MNCAIRKQRNNDNREVYMMKMITLLMFALVLPGCVLVVDGNDGDWNSYDGLVTERSVNITNVTAIDNNFHGRLHIIQGEDEGVRMRGKGKSLEKVSIEQKGDTLFLDTRVDISFDFAGWEYHYPEKLDVYVTVANLDRLQVHGHGVVRIETLQTGDLDIEIDGGQLEVGNLVAENVSINIDGHGSVSIEELLVTDLIAEMNGHGAIDVHFLDSDTLDLRIAGHGAVELKGKTEIQKVSIEGHGQLSADELSSETARLRIVGHGTARVWATGILILDVEEHGAVKYKGHPTIKYVSDPAIQQISASED
jgi:hypothetical protein